MPQLELEIPPPYCQYSGGPCDQHFSDAHRSQALVLYPSSPEMIALTIEGAVSTLRRRDPSSQWSTWKDLRIAGQMIFCTICKSSRFSETLVADVTTLNLNLLFEIGFSLGLERPVIPIRDTSFDTDKDDFERLGFLDTLGYLDFQNSTQLADLLLDRLPVSAIPAPPTPINSQAPIYVLKGPIETEGAVRMISVLKKSPLRFRSLDPIETPRISLHELRKQVAASIGVVANLLDPNRGAAKIHNARAALMAGMAMASGKIVTLLQEGGSPQPIDYRDVVRPYHNPEFIEALLEPLIRGVVERLQDSDVKPKRLPEGLLESLDLGDVAAENEIRALRDYFVPTAQFQDARRGHARLVVGRKGAGKTAIFYAVREAFFRRRSHLVLDLKPEGHQFTRLREAVLSRLSPGLQEHTLVAFWNYILLAEMAQKISDHDYSYAQRDLERRDRFEHLMAVYESQVPSAAGDFSERLLRQVDRLCSQMDRSATIPETAGALTELLFRRDIPALDDALSEYLREREEIWILVDNLDKGWPTRGASPEDIAILRALLEATRRLQRQFERRDLDLHALVFLRNDIHDHLIQQTSDRGKDTAILVDWPDRDVFRHLIRERLTLHQDLDGSFEQVWGRVFVPHIGVEDSFNYLLERTLMRPRDLLSLLHRCVEVAVNRGHGRVEAIDVELAVKIYSEDMLKTTGFELRDVFPSLPDPLYVFLGCPLFLSEDDVLLRLMEAGLEESKAREGLEVLIWFSFLGVKEARQEEARYSYDVRYNVDKLLAAASRKGSVFVVHPAFRDALECVERAS